MFSLLRHEVRSLTSSLCAAARPRFNTTAAAAPAYVPPASAGDVQQRRSWGRRLIKPESPNTFTGRADFYDAVDGLEEALTYSRQALRQLELLPLPQFALQSLPPPQPAWKSKKALLEMMQTRLTPSRYTRLITLLQQLDQYRRIAVVAGLDELAASIEHVVEVFEREDKEAYLARGQRKPVPLDEFGRTYTVGRRKESHARVWVIRTKLPEPEAAPAQEAAAPELNMPASMPELSQFNQPKPKAVPVTQILINNTPLAEYFASPIDRERVLRSLSLTGTLGAFNIFAIVRGGGSTGQAGAISLGIAKGVLAHMPDLSRVLRKAKLLRRDPRMVERKKPGLAKARKAYTWVKR
ncbi:SSU ribosomal protein S9P [Phanerochaete sordida]|uniref:SSU ribosomal protein S9P n=1 Tax=Phanerochaete sordida TaxID=48140 RepID=A0A9P3GI49_9APHY|nr:SSU ribosomal protein S9P [Phanerochaete sordida]